MEIGFSHLGFAHLGVTGASEWEFMDTNKKAVHNEVYNARNQR